MQRIKLVLTRLRKQKVLLKKKKKNTHARRNLTHIFGIAKKNVQFIINITNMSHPIPNWDYPSSYDYEDETEEDPDYNRFSEK